MMQAEEALLIPPGTEAEEQHSIDVISLVMPNEARFVSVARILVGGLAARLDCPYEALDDLQLAVESSLAEAGPRDGDVTIELTVRDDAIEVTIGPIDPVAIETTGSDGDPGALDLAFLLPNVVDDVRVDNRDGTHWLRLEKLVVLPAGD